jgi:3'(2'), 5'-bisphosphate nucleotidase
MHLDSADIAYLIETCRLAGDAVMDVYAGRIDVERKSDGSPLTEADLRSNAVICHRLASRFPGVPVVSEESAAGVPWEERRNWRACWLVDPLDGTKEFIRRNGQFTVNIALAVGGRPVAGLVLAPALGRLYYTAPGEGAFRADGTGVPARLPLPRERAGGEVVVVGSLSHHAAEVDDFVAALKKRHGSVRFVSMGSALKICLVADGTADFYPRFGPTMEWDTAAAHAVANAAGCRVRRPDSGEELVYNKENLLNPHFIVERAGEA